MTQQNPWEDYDWDLIGDANHKQVHHLTIQDLRRYIFLATKGQNAIASEAVFAAQVEDGPKRFAASWQDTLLDYPDSGLSYSDTGSFPTVCDGAVRAPQYRPGSIIVYFERSFSHALQGVSVDVDLMGEFVFNATQIQKYGIYTQNSSTINGVLRQWYKEEDDFRPGTPFIIKNSANAANDGFYRVRSVRKSGSYVYVTPDNNNYEQQELVACSAGGTATCDFGGDWYTLRGGNGNCVDAAMRSGGEMDDYFASLPDAAYGYTSKENWWTVKDLYHRYEKTDGAVTFGPEDGRPPTGGQMSKDFNADWVRCPNPSRYHTYDKNSHRYHVEAETDGSYEGSFGGGDYEQFTALIPSYKFLCFDADPKEQESPFFFEDTNRVHWKYGKKVRFRARDITNPSKLGAIQAVRSTGYTPTNNPPVGTGTDHQYNSTYTRNINNGEMCEDGYLPVVSGQSYMSKWIDAKYDDALQNMVELAASRAGWVWPVDNDYKYNWLWVHKYTTISTSLEEWLIYDKSLDEHYFRTYENGEWVLTSTYWDVYTEFGISDAYQPGYDQNQPEYDYMNSEYWGENGSAFELILKLLGSSYYDWYYDETYPYRSKNILDTGWEWAAGMDEDDYTWPVTFNGIECNSINDIREACWQIPVGVWRRTWKYTYGRVKDCKMRDGSREAPGSFPTAASGGDWPYEFYHPDETGGNKTIRMIGRVVMSGDEPADSEFYTWSETGWTVPDGGQPNTIRFSGDKTDEFKTGNVVWTKKSGSYYSYHVLKVVYDSTGDTTTITLSSHFATDSPTVLYGDINLSLHHDPAFVVNDTPCYPINRLTTILKHCRSAMKKLKYKDLDISVSYVGQNQGSYPYGMQFESQEALYEYYMADTFTDAIDEYYWDDNMENWATYDINDPYGIVFGVIADYIYRKKDAWGVPFDPPYWEQSGGSTGYIQFAVKIDTPIYFDKEAVKFIHKLAFRGINYHLPARNVKIGIQGYGIFDIPKYDEVNECYPPYKRIYLPIVAESDTVQYIRIKALTDLRDWMFYDSNIYTDYYHVDMTASCISDSGAGPSFIVDFDWNKFSDAIWARTNERADYKLIDPFGPDTNPPVAKNEWVIEPTLYDANFDTFYAKNQGGATDYNYPYDQPNYSPHWKIKAEAVLMEDLEGNGVEYIFNFEHDIYDTEAGAMDATQSSRKLDKTLGSSGNSSDAFAALEDLIDEWEVTLNSKDCYSGNVPGEDDNYGTPTSAVNITIESPIFPMMARWVPDATHGNPLKVYLDYDPYSGQDRNWLLFILDEYLPGQSNTSLQYKIECEKPDGTVYELTWHTKYGGSVLTDDYPASVTINDLPSIANGNHKLCLWLNLDDNPDYYVAGMKYRVVVQEGSGPERTAWSADSIDPTTHGNYTIEI